MYSQEHVVPAGLKTSKSADLILINTPLRDYGQRQKDDYEVLPPLGEAFIATIADETGFNVGLIDAEHHGNPIDEVTQAINALNPLLAGLNVLTPTRLVGLEIASKINSDITLAIGAAHATAMPERTIREYSAVHPNTVLFMGQAQHSITELLSGKNPSELQGAIWVNPKNGQIERSNVRAESAPHFSTWPHINRKFLDNDPSIDTKHGRKEARVLTSLNCPFDCTFCSGARSATSLPTLHRSPEDVANEIANLVTNHQIESVRFVDDLLLTSEKRVNSILSEMHKRGVTSLLWDATGRANILARFSESSIRSLIERGMHETAIGIESGSERLRTRINKRVTLAEIERSIRMITENGGKTKGYFIVGLPGETKEETEATINMARRLTIQSNSNFRASIFVFRPYPGTAEWNELIRQGWNEDSLLDMHADDTGERSKHSVTTRYSFSELHPNELGEALHAYYNWQSNYIQ